MLNGFLILNQKFGLRIQLVFKMRFTIIIPLTSGFIRLQSIKATRRQSAVYIGDNYRSNSNLSNRYLDLFNCEGAFSSLLDENAIGYEIRLSDGFESGNSWELPIAIAHWILRSGHEIVDNEPDYYIWSTGALDLNLNVVPSDYSIDKKINEFHKQGILLPDERIVFLLPHSHGHQLIKEKFPHSYHFSIDCFSAADHFLSSLGFGRANSLSNDRKYGIRKLIEPLNFPFLLSKNNLVFTTCIIGLIFLATFGLWKFDIKRYPSGDDLSTSSLRPIESIANLEGGSDKILADRPSLFGSDKSELWIDPKGLNLEEFFENDYWKSQVLSLVGQYRLERLQFLSRGDDRKFEENGGWILARGCGKAKCSQQEFLYAIDPNGQLLVLFHDKVYKDIDLYGETNFDFHPVIRDYVANTANYVAINQAFALLGPEEQKFFLEIVVSDSRTLASDGGIIAPEYISQFIRFALSNSNDIPDFSTTKENFLLMQRIISEEKAALKLRSLD